MKRLIILDLDNTLIYSGYSAQLKITKMFKYMDFLYVYERPFAREFIQQCREIGELMVFTLSEREYAEQVSVNLNIRPTVIYTGDDCINSEGEIRKKVPEHYYEIYDQIIIVDDNPKIWDDRHYEHCMFIVPSRFTGDKRDGGLKLLMNTLSEYMGEKR